MKFLIYDYQLIEFFAWGSISCRFIYEPLQIDLIAIDWYHMGHGPQEFVIEYRQTCKIRVVTNKILNQQGQNVTHMY